MPTREIPRLNPYIPARLVQGKARWYIIYYQTDPIDGQMKRFRETHNLNRIKDKKLREKTARQWIKEINRRLPAGYPFEDFQSQLQLTPIHKAIEKAKQIKCKTGRYQTAQSYSSMCNIFVKWLEKEGMAEMPIADFDRSMAMAFMDHALIDRGISSNTFNNYLTYMRTIFNELLSREFLFSNPFKEIKKRRPEQKKRRAFNDEEKKIVLDYIYKKDKLIFLAVILQYYCFIRPSELRRLRFKHFDFTAGVIRLSSDETKNWQNAIITIPNSLMPLLKDLNVDKLSKSYYVFGKHGKHHPDTQIGKNTLRTKHRKLLKELHQSGTLDDIQGLTLYSWKDTGVMELFRKKVNILEIMKQLRHSDLSITQKYCQGLHSVNEEIKTLSNGIHIKTAT